ncbi:MAG: hypothetical protein OEW22_08285, partial [Rubrivivax sp.]|nr:hypothetical protein [Rubrivivax sp.]
MAQTTSRTATQALPTSLSWATVVNSADVMPGTSRNFNSFNQPSVNASGLVVLRARSRGGQGAGEPVRGIYQRLMSKGP